MEIKHKENTKKKVESEKERKTEKGQIAKVLKIEIHSFLTTVVQTVYM